MVKKRLIPIVLLKDGWIVQSRYFKEYKNLGNPFDSVKRLSEWCSDEIFYIDITKPGARYDMRRDDLNKENLGSLMEIIARVSKTTFMPIGVGGKIRNLSDIEERLSRGADKITLNTQAIDDPAFITEASKEFGSQCIVISIDFKKVGDEYLVYKGGHEETDLKAKDWAKKVQDLGAGEVLVNSIDRDGSKMGFQVDLIASVAEELKIPVIACGGAGSWLHFFKMFESSAVSAVAAANIFHHVDQSVFLAKKFLYDKGINIRNPKLLKIQK